ncbi:MAG: galactokinase [Deltaproteobacteria bacterium]|nr:galactokinase [Deltaproteobacteria bacterium]
MVSSNLNVPPPLSLKKSLENSPVEASAPCRIDSGGTWDIKPFALPMAPVVPVTINLALTLRTKVALAPFTEGRVRISSHGFFHDEEYSADTCRFDTPFGLFFAAVACFACHGLEVHIRAASPVKAALGGSSTALIALIKALSKATAHPGRRMLTRKEILHLGYHLEDSVSVGRCGIQDQAAAVYGGVNQWIWHYESTKRLFRRQPLLNRGGQREMSEHLLLAYSGTSHVSSRMNQAWMKNFLSGKTRAGWVKVNDVVRRLGPVIKKKAWEEAATLLREEMAVRREITPDALIPITDQLIHQAENEGCGARFTGAGAGGSVWALGEKARITRLRKLWLNTLTPVKGACLLPCEVDPNGVR